MEKRRFGRTEHMSSVAIFGTAAIRNVSQAEADVSMEQVINHGVNHIDVAPTYGDAELRLAPWMASHRDQFFLGCKTLERSREGAKKEMMRSLERLGTDHFDLYQLHAITTLKELDQVTKAGGALEAFCQARTEGLIRFIGITGHGPDVPMILMEALERFDFESVLFPLNSILLGISGYGEKALELLEKCKQKDVGVMAIKSITKGPWGGKPRTHSPWYEPFTSEKDIQKAVSFALSYDVTGICTASDSVLLPTILKACETYTAKTNEEREEMIETSRQYDPIYEPPPK
jgi:aryl-alcohol dehydrogenase-like predicted oxidoreductase